MSGDRSVGPNRFWSIWPVRLVVLFVLTVLTYATMSAPVMFKALPKLFSRDELALGCAAVAALLTLLVYRLLVRLTERRTPDELAGATAPFYFVKGALIGLALFATVYAVLFALHVARFNGVGTTQDLVIALALSLASGVCEEIIFRGVVFRILENATGTLAALIVSGGLFGLMHGFNPGATIVSTLAIALEAGVLLAAAYVLTRSLWFPIGLHFAWNFAEGGVFGAPVSGYDIKGLFDAPISGPALWSGGTFGPEASIVAIGLCTALGVVMVVMAIRRDQWRPARLSWRG